MSNVNKNLKDYKFGLSNSKKKIGINMLRYFFNGVEMTTGADQRFFVEFEMLNPWLSPNETLLGFKTRVKVSEEDLQYALAGTQSAQNIDTETIVQPSYCVIRVGKLGANAKQLCNYVPVKEVTFNQKPFEISIGNKSFTETRINGFLSISQEEISAHPELLCESGYVTWDLTYEVRESYGEGYSDNSMRWFPYGLKTFFSGKINFDGTDYLVDTRRCSGYVERYWGNEIPEPWFHINTADLTSVITGKTLFDSSFSIQGSFQDRVSFIGKFEDLEIKFCADGSKRQYTTIWDCTQMPESENPEENQLHWSVSINHKLWIVDVDIYCKIKELYNRSLEMPQGERKVLNLLEGATGIGEIKLYRRIGNTLEQLEHARLNKVICEFGHIEKGEN